MLQGTVKSFSREKGWGFIVPDDGGADVFVHARNLRGVEIAQGARVGFNERDTEKGRRATSVIVLTRDSGLRAVVDRSTCDCDVGMCTHRPNCRDTASRGA